MQSCNLAWLEHGKDFQFPSSKLFWVLQITPFESPLCPILIESLKSYGFKNSSLKIEGFENPPLKMGKLMGLSELCSCVLNLISEHTCTASTQNWPFVKAVWRVQTRDYFLIIHFEPSDTLEGIWNFSPSNKKKTINSFPANQTILLSIIRM